MEPLAPTKSHCGLYAFFHEGKYYCFLDEDASCDGLNRQFDRADIVRILQEGGSDLLETLRTVFDFVETGVTNRDDDGGGRSSALVRNNPNPEWEKAFAKACVFFPEEVFPAFWNLDLVDLGRDGMLNSLAIDKSTSYMYAIDLDNNFFHEQGNTLESKYLVVSHPITGLTIEILEKLHSQNEVEEGFCSQSFPLPHEYEKAIIDDLSYQGYQYCCELTRSYAPILWRVKEKATGRDRCVHVFLPPLFQQPFCIPPQERHMTVTELLMANPIPHPNLVRVWKRLTLHGNPALIIDTYDSDLQTAREKLSRQQLNFIMGQVVEGIIYLHKHGIVHHEIKPSNVLIKYINNETSGGGEDGGACEKIAEAVIHDFQSISIPSGRYQNLKRLSWGSFSNPDDNTPDGHHPHDERWLSGWAPMKKSFRFLRSDYGAANPWSIDCSSVAMMFLLNNLDIYQAYQDSSVSDYHEHPEYAVFFNVVNLYQSHAKSAADAIEELQATIRTLSSMDATIETEEG